MREITNPKELAIISGGGGLSDAQQEHCNIRVAEIMYDALWLGSLGGMALVAYAGIKNPVLGITLWAACAVGVMQMFGYLDKNYSPHCNPSNAIYWVDAGIF